MKLSKSELKLENFNRCPGEYFDDAEVDFYYVDVVEDDEEDNDKVTFVENNNDDDDNEWVNSSDTAVILIDTKKTSVENLGAILAHIATSSVNDCNYAVRAGNLILRLWWD